MEQIIQLICERESFVLTGHTSPDGDAIGSCFGLAFALEKLGKKVIVMLEPYPQKYNIIPGRKFLHKGDKPTDVDVLIALDCGDINRLGLGQEVFSCAKHTICIDHHKTNEGFAQYNYIEPNTASTSEIVFRLIEQLTEPTIEIAQAIYAGIVSDTNGFRYEATSASTMHIAAKLMDMGIPFTDIYNEVTYIHDFSSNLAKGIVIQNTKKTDDDRIIYSHISREELASVGADSSDLDGLVEYLRDTRGANIAALIYEKGKPPTPPPEENTVKISFRSNGPDVSAVAATIGGGGHRLAAGATTTGTIDSVAEQVLNLLESELIAYDRRT